MSIERLALVLLVSSCGLSEWVNHSPSMTRIVNGCTASDKFGTPRMVRGVCVVAVKRELVCGNDIVRQSVTHIALPEGEECAELDPSTDYFEIPAGGYDEELLGIARNVRSLLAREDDKPSKSFRALPAAVASELLRRKMSAFSSLLPNSHQASPYSYVLRFELPDCRCTATLHVSDDASKFQWSIEIE